jgi:DNA-binding transcriptional regulator LsrR (DeoR family)
VFGLELARLKSIPSVVGIAGGKRKHQAMLALRGRWVNILITDQFSAEALVRADGVVRANLLGSFGAVGGSSSTKTRG